MFTIQWTDEAAANFSSLRGAADAARHNREKKKVDKTSKQEGLFKQVLKCIDTLGKNPRHPSLHTHPFDSLVHPYDPRQKVLEAYAQNSTPGAYRVFWCYGPNQKEITIVAITAHP